MYLFFYNMPKQAIGKSISLFVCFQKCTQLLSFIQLSSHLKISKSKHTSEIMESWSFPFLDGGSEVQKQEEIIIFQETGLEMT